MKISVVIPLFNKELSVRRAIESVLSQSYPPYEVIVVNDGSTDAGEIVVRNFTDSRIILINQNNRGVSEARNRGIAEAKSEHICLLDADDEWHPNFLAEINKLASVYTDAVVYSIRHQRIDENGKLFRPKVALPDGFFGILKCFPESYRKGYGIIHSSSVCLKRSLYDQGHIFPVGEKKGEDIYYWLKASQLGDMAFSNKTLSTVHLDSENRSGEMGTFLPCHIRWYLLERLQILKQTNGKEICKFIFYNALVHVYGNAAINNYNYARIIIKAFIQAGNLKAGFFLPAFIIPQRILQKIRRARRTLE